MNDIFSHAGLGHNGAPPYVPDDLLAKVADFAATAGEWLDVKAISSAEQAARCTDYLDGARELFKLLDSERRRQKIPHDEAAKAVQEVFRPSLEKVDFSIKRVGSVMTAWLSAEKRRQEEQQRQERAEAQRLRREAEDLARMAEARNDIDGMVAAQAQLAEAERAQKEASKKVSARAGSATGGGRLTSLRVTTECVVESKGVALARYRDHPEVIALIERLATAEVRAQKGEKVAPNGFKLVEKESAA